MPIRMRDLLTLVGRLDDAPGFDSPRERFRRFLAERITEPSAASAILEDCQKAIGEQPHRVLQDTVVLLGRFLGFETTFGTYQRAGGGVRFDGQWRSRGRMHVVLEVRSDQIHAADFDSLDRSVAAMAAANHVDPASCLGLCVVARQYAGRVRLESLATAEGRKVDVRVVSVDTLAWLATMAVAGRITHDDVLRLFKSTVALDFVVGLLEQVSSAALATVATMTAVPAAAAADAPHEAAASAMPVQGFWVSTITDSDSAAPEQLLASVIGERHVLGVTSPGPDASSGAPGDWIGLFVPGKGIVGHAQLGGVVGRGAGVVRHSERFSRVYRLEHVELYEEPRVPPAGREQTFTAAGRPRPASGPFLVPVSREDFVTLTKWREDSAAEAREASAGVDARREAGHAVATDRG